MTSASQNRPPITHLPIRELEEEHNNPSNLSYKKRGIPHIDTKTHSIKMLPDIRPLNLGKIIQQQESLPLSPLRIKKDKTFISLMKFSNDSTERTQHHFYDNKDPKSST
ncbi:MAG: hypothetical protein ACMG6E_08450 [Candidatus Roizmanbacteria bacterium]